MFPTLVALALTQVPPALPADRAARWEKDIAAVEARLKDAPPEPGGVLFAGSSSVRLWDLNKSFPDRKYTNVGFGGSQLPDVTAAAPRLILPHRPAAVVVYAGDNDLAAGRKPEEVADDFRTFASVIHGKLPRTKVYFVAIKPSPKRWDLYGLQKRANELIRAHAATDDRFGYIDVVPAMLGADGRPKPELFVQDDLHLSPKGYEVWAEAVGRAVK